MFDRGADANAAVVPVALEQIATLEAIDIKLEVGTTGRLEAKLDRS